MAYEDDILRILSKVGSQGIAVAALSKHVYNMHVSLFSQPDLENIHRSVQQYLLRQSRLPKGKNLVERVRHGYYRLNTRNAVVRQLVIGFRMETDSQEAEPPAPAPVQDFSLSLFD